MNTSDKVSRCIKTHIKYISSFKEVPAAFTRSFDRKGVEYTFLGMSGNIDRHLDRTVNKIISLIKEPNHDRTE
jgi:hypothetical protein